MKQSTSPQLSAILMTMANINDNIKQSNQILEKLLLKIEQLNTDSDKTIKHIVYLEEKKKEQDK
jgi:hypothetical protein